MVSARVRRGATWMTMALLAGGCAPGPRPPEIPGAAAAPAVRPVERAASEPGVRAVAAATAPVQLLPDTTAVVMNIAGIGSLLAMVDVDALVAKFRPFYDQGAALLTGSVGANLLDPTQWSLIGVDAAGPMGLALVDVRSATVVAYATISDPTRLRGFIDRVGGSGRMQPVFEDRGLVLKSDPDSSSALVLRDGFVFLVASDRPNEASTDVARLLATIDPARGLTASTRYQQAIAGGAPAPGLTAYVDLWSLLAGELDRATGREGPSRAERDLERARADGAAPEVLDGLRAQVDVEHEWARKDLERRARTHELGKRWLGEMSPVVFEFTASASGVVGTIRAKMPETAPLRAALRNAAEPSPVLMALGERPVVMFGGSVDVPAALAEFEALLRADGEDPAKVYAELGAALKIAEPRREMSELLTGTGGFALTVSEARLRGEGRGGERDVGFALGVGVTDVGRAEALLERAWKQMSVVAMRSGGKDRATGAHTLEVPGYRTVHAKVVGQQLVVTTDIGVIQRIAAGSPTATHKWLEPAVVPVLTARDAAMQGFGDLILAGLLVSNRSSVRDDASEPMQPYWQFVDVRAEQIDAVPRSAAYKAKIREWRALNAKIRKRDQAQGRIQAQLAVDAARSLGALAGSLREQPDGLVLAGGQLFGKGGLTRAIERMVDYMAKPTSRDEALHALVEARGALEREMQVMRMKEVARALKLPTPEL